jgi:hypothetical protein
MLFMDLKTTPFFTTPPVLLVRSTQRLKSPSRSNDWIGADPQPVTPLPTYRGPPSLRQVLTPDGSAGRLHSSRI